MIAPRCYPVDGAEAIVNIKLLRALTKENEFVIDLVSRKDLKVNYPSDSIDSYQVSLHGLYLIENKGGFSFLVLLQSILAFFIFRCFFPRCHWAVRALPVIKKLVETNQYDFVLTKSSPSFLLGSYLKKKGLKWVASWNDPFPSTFYPSPYGKGAGHKQTLLEKLQLRQMRKADVHIFPTKTLQNHMQSYLHVDEDTCYVAPHVVFDDQSKSNEYKTLIEKGCLKIIHSGNLSSPRNPRPVINALCRMVKNMPNIEIHFTFLGKMEKSDEDYIKSLICLKNVVTLIPMVEYKKSLEILETHDVACVIEADCGVGGGVFLPTKVTDFMQTHKPMLAVSPKKGVLEELHNDGAVGYFADIHDENSIYEGLMNVYHDYTQGALKKSFVPETYQPSSIVSVYKDIASKLRS